MTIQNDLNQMVLFFIFNSFITELKKRKKKKNDLHTILHSIITTE